MELKDALAAIVGPTHVDPAGDRHLQDVTENPPGHADFVVRPKTADEVRSLVLLAWPDRRSSSTRSETTTMRTARPSI